MPAAVGSPNLPSTEAMPQRGGPDRAQRLAAPTAHEHDDDSNALAGVIVSARGRPSRSVRYPIRSPSAPIPGAVYA
jgi:hypothetical protein